MQSFSLKIRARSLQDETILFAPIVRWELTTTTPASLAGLAVLFSRQIPAVLYMMIFIFFRYETIRFHADAMFMVIILSIVSWSPVM